jgi:phosphatidate cytidylyltransferase
MACAFSILKTKERVFILLISATLISLSYVSLHPLGIEMLLSLALIISACDIGAYFSGRLIGGPKLAPSVSPSKTWAGSIGGIVCALIAAACLYYLLVRLPLSSSAFIFVLIIAILSQIGDLFESSMKRRLNIKDSGRIVPGHGGALDRFDGYLTSLPVAAFMLHFELPLIATLATL